VESINISADYASGSSFFGYPSALAEVTIFQDAGCTSDNQWLKKSNISKIISWQVHTNYWGSSKKDFDLIINVQTNGYDLAITGKNSLEAAIPFFEKHLGTLKKSPTSNIP